MNIIRFCFIPLFFITLLFTTCNQQPEVPREMPDSVRAYIYSYSDEVISRREPITIRFAGNVIAPEQVDTPADQLTASITPDVAGNWHWTDRQTVVFTPAEPLDFATQYLVSVQIKDLFDNVPEEAHTFQFGVQTRDPFLSLKQGYITTPDFDQRQEQIYQGSLITSDYLADEAATTLLTAEQNNRKLAITWSHNDNGTEHYFTVKGIQRKEEAEQLYLNWDGSSFGATQKGSETVEIPALGDFKVIQVEAIGKGESTVIVYFSDPLDENQNFTGLVTVSGSENSFRYNADNQQLTVYTNESLSGEHEIRVNPGIRNRYGDRLVRPAIWNVGFTATPPEVRLVGHGNIIPTGTTRMFPFEAIGLNSVEVEVFKIYHNNILQFLQENDLDGNYALRSVGKIVQRKTVALRDINPQSSSATEWSYYALDLEQFFQLDAKAFYQVRIGFRPQHSLYACGEQTDFDYYTPYDQDNYNQSIMDSWSGIEGGYRSQSWQHRDDPCYPAYYGRNRFVSRTILSSNLGIIAKEEQSNNYRVIVTNLQTAKPENGAVVHFYDFQQQLLHTVSTDSDGVARASLEEQPFFVVAETSDDQGYLRLDGGTTLSLSRFDVGGSRTQAGLKGYLYGERGVWRPGDEIFLNFILEDQNGSLPPDYPINFELRDAQGQMVLTRDGISPQGYIYPIHISTAADAPTGIWQAKVTAGDAVFTKSLRIETIKPNRIKMNVQANRDPVLVADGGATLSLQADWLHGAPAANLKANIEATFNNSNLIFEDFSDYNFFDRTKSSYQQNMVVYDGELNDNGSVQGIPFTPPNASTAAGPIRMQLRTRVFERGGNFSTETSSLTVHPFRYYAGVKPPTDRYGSTRIILNKATNVQLAAVNYEGQAAARRLKVELAKVEWRWWWDDETYGGGRYARERTRNVVDQTELSTNSNGKAEWSTKVSEWGRYQLKVCDTESGHCAVSYMYAGSPWYGESTYSEEAAMLSMMVDKEQYAPGESVTLSFPAGGTGKALLSIENGNGVLEERWIDTQPGDNTYTFETNAEMAPNVYAFLTVLQPYDQEANDLPLRAYGVVPIIVEDPATRLAPQVVVPKELKPEEDFIVKVSESAGQAMSYTLAVVDEGLLSLTNFKTPDPHTSFYAREALGVRTWDMFRYVLGRHDTPMNKVLTIGGDGEANGTPKADRANRFDPVVMHLGPFELERGQTAQHKLTMPNYIGEVRVMVVAAKPGGAYGSTEVSTPVRKPLMVLATLPRVLGVGETLELPVNVFAMRDRLGDVQVQVTESSGLVGVSTPGQQLTFSRMGDQLLRVPIQVGDQTGVARFTITATGGGERTTQEIEIDVRNPNPVQTRTERFTLARNEEATFEFVPFGTAGTRSGILEMTNLPPLDLERHLRYVLRYPYGCVEQTTTAAMAQLHLPTFTELTDNQTVAAREHVSSALQRLRRYQRSDGGFAYWPGNNEISAWSTSYVGHFMLAAKTAGYTLPAGMLADWLSFQKAAARRWDGRTANYGEVSKNSYELGQAYRLYTLALAGEADLGAMNRLRERPALGKTARWRLAAAYALADQQDAGLAMIRNTNTEVDTYRELDYTYGSRLRDQAMILEALLLLDKSQDADQVARLISDQMRSGRWLSTHDIGFCLLAFSQYVDSNDALQDTYTFRYQQNRTGAQDVGATQPYFQLLLKDQAGAVTVKNTSTQKLFGSIIRKGQPLPETEAAASENLNISITYKAPNGETIDVRQLPQGTDFVAEVTIKHPYILRYTYRQLALEQVFPSGWEITNTRFETLSTKPESYYTYRDFRDDRVHTFFNLGGGKSHTYRVYLTAAYAGRFYLPATNCQAMYDESIHANTEGYWVEVVGN